MNKNQVFSLVEVELDRAAGVYGRMNSSDEGYNILKAEVDELWYTVLSGGDLNTQCGKAIQIAATAFRYVLDVTGDPNE